MTKFSLVRSSLPLPPTSDNVIRLPIIRPDLGAGSHHSTETVRLQIVRETTSIALEISRR